MPNGLCEFHVLSFSLCSAPATFQRLMDTVLSGLKWQTCLVYCNDVIALSAEFEEHLRRLKPVFEAIRSAGLTLQPEMSHFDFEELQFLVQVVNHKGVRPGLDTIADIRKLVANFLTPSDKKGHVRFSGPSHLLLAVYFEIFAHRAAINTSHQRCPLRVG